MAERRSEDGVAVAAAAGRAGQVDDERAAEDAGGPAREKPVRRLCDRVRAERLGDPRRLALEHGARRLGCHVARRNPRPARCQNERRLSGKLLDRGCDLVRLVGDNAARDVVAVRLEQLCERVAARVRGLAPRHAVGHREHGRVHRLIFSTSSTSNVICLSIAFAMS